MFALEAQFKPVAMIRVSGNYRPEGQPARWRSASEFLAEIGKLPAEIEEGGIAERDVGARDALPVVELDAPKMAVWKVGLRDLDIPGHDVDVCHDNVPPPIKVGDE